MTNDDDESSDFDRAAEKARRRALLDHGLHDPFAATMPRRITVAERDIRALTMRKQGYSFAEIAKELNLTSAQHAWNLVEKQLNKAVGTEVRELRQIEDHRLDDLLRAWWPAAVGAASDDGTPSEPSRQAAEVVLRVSEARRKLLGLDAPTRSEISGPEGGPIPQAIAKLTPDELEAALARLEEMYGGKPEPIVVEPIDTEDDDQ